MNEDIFKMRDIFLPHEARRRNALLASGTNLIHYTSAAAAVEIIGKKKVWMRNLRCMNDFSEVDHGISLMQRSLRPPVESEAESGLRAVFRAVDSVFPDTSGAAIKWFDDNVFRLSNKTYITCLSEHAPNELEHGRLSMWRSYTSNQVGVGLVINPMPLYSVTTSYGAFSSPVYYFTDIELRDVFIEISKNITQNRDYVERQGREMVHGFLCILLRSIAMCTKHPGFVEEKEWRIMHTEGIDEQGVLEVDVECVNGIPQPVYKMPLQSQPNLGIVGIDIPQLLSGVIIGPTQFPFVVWDAISMVLSRAGVDDAMSIIKPSNIPLRT
ncbi:DUF2971 domain-containing protein [Pleomorphomonas carboxyditropha]|nr:DUF2971 domain-containing protein [Pleomorphomonas carboxyditropha]